MRPRRDATRLDSTRRSLELSLLTFYPYTFYCISLYSPNTYSLSLFHYRRQARHDQGACACGFSKAIKLLCCCCCCYCCYCYCYNCCRARVTFVRPCFCPSRHTRDRATNFAISSSTHSAKHRGIISPRSAAGAVLTQQLMKQRALWPLLGDV